MSRNSTPSNSEEKRVRIKKLMSLAGLETLGFAEYVEISESHIYAILNGNRELTIDVANKIAEGFNLTGEQLLKANFKLTKKVIDKRKLDKFYTEHKGVIDYFLATKEKRRIAVYFESKLLHSGLFNTPVSVSHIRNICKEQGKEFPSKRISQVLKYLVETKKLKSKKKPIILKSGKSGNRIIDYYYI